MRLAATRVCSCTPSSLAAVGTSLSRLSGVLSHSYRFVALPLGHRSHASPASSLICSHSLVFRFRPLGLRSHASPASSPLVVAQRRGAGLAPWTYALSVASMSGSSFSAASRDISSACPMQVRVYIAQMSCVRTGGRRGKGSREASPLPLWHSCASHAVSASQAHFGSLAFLRGKVWGGMVGVLALSRHVCACASRV